MAIASATYAVETRDLDREPQMSFRNALQGTLVGCSAAFSFLVVASFAKGSGEGV